MTTFKTYKVFAYFQHFFDDKEHGTLEIKLPKDIKDEDIRDRIIWKLTIQGFYNINIISIEQI